MYVSRNRTLLPAALESSLPISLSVFISGSSHSLYAVIARPETRGLYSDTRMDPMGYYTTPILNFLLLCALFLVHVFDVIPIILALPLLITITYVSSHLSAAFSEFRTSPTIQESFTFFFVDLYHCLLTFKSTFLVNKNLKMIKCLLI